MTPEQRAHAWQGILTVVEELAKAEPGSFPHGGGHTPPGGSIRSRAIDNEDGSVSCNYEYGEPMKKVRITVQIEEADRHGSSR